MLTAPLDTGSFDKKLQDPWALLFRPSFSCGRNCRTLVQSNSVLLFFDGTFQFHNFSINSSCIFFSKNSLNQYILQFCCKDLVVVWVAQTFNLESLKCTIKGKSIYWGYKYNNQGHSCQQLLQIVVPLIINCRSLGLCFFGPPFLVGEIAGPLFKAIRSSFSLMGHSSSTIFLSMLVVFFFKEQP